MNLFFVLTIVAAIVAATLIGVKYETKLIGGLGKYFLSTAKTLSWICCLGFLSLLLAPLLKGVKPDMRILGLLGFLLVHLFLLVIKHYRVAFYFTVTEIFFSITFWALYIYTGMETPPSPNFDVSVGCFGFWLFLVGSGILIFFAWICLKAAQEISRPKEVS